MKPTKTEIATAVGQLSMMRYFPGSDIAQQAVMQLLERLVANRQELNWLVQVMITQVREWPGPAELRGLFCTRFAPADGIEGNCTLPGWTQLDFEQRVINQHEQNKIGWTDKTEERELLSEFMGDFKRMDEAEPRRRKSA